MVSGTKQQEKIKTIKERNIVLNLSDADCERLFELCGENNLTVSKLLETFIGDLVGGTYSNGSDERDLAELWFERCGFRWNPKPTLLQWLLEEVIDVEMFFDLIDDIKTAYEDLENYQKDSAAFDDEEIKFLKTDIEDWEEELADYKSRYKKENPDADWEKEIVDVKKWFETKERFVKGENLSLAFTILKKELSKINNDHRVVYRACEFTDEIDELVKSRVREIQESEKGK